MNQTFVKAYYHFVNMLNSSKDNQLDFMIQLLNRFNDIVNF